MLMRAGNWDRDIVLGRKGLNHRAAEAECEAGDERSTARQNSAQVVRLEVAMENDFAQGGERNEDFDECERWQRFIAALYEGEGRYSRPGDVDKWCHGFSITRIDVPLGTNVVDEVRGRREKWRQSST
jgi:hypothetical protein